MYKFLKTLAICALMVLPVFLSSAQNQHVPPATLHDSLMHLLGYFYAATDDEKLKQDIEVVRRLYTNTEPGDAVGEKLMGLARQIREIFSDYIRVNMYPFDRLKVLELAKKNATLFQHFPSAGANELYASAMHHVGLTYLTIAYNKPADAIPYFREALQIRKKLLGEKNPDYLETLFYSILSDERTGNDQKLEQMLPAFEWRNKIVGKENLVYEDELSCICSIYKDLHDFKKADSLLQLKISIGEKMYGAGSLRFARILFNAGVNYDEMSQYIKALQLFTRAKEITESNSGRESQQYFICMDGIGSMYQNMGQYRQALEISSETLEYAWKWDSVKNTSLPLYFYSQAGNYMKLGEYSSALPLLQEAIKKNAELNDEIGSDYIWNRIAELYIALGQYDEAAAIIKKGLVISERRGGIQNNIFYMRLLNNMAILYGQKKQYDSAIYYCRQSLYMTQTMKGEQHRDYLKFLNNLIQLYLDSRKYSDADKALQELLVTEEKIYGNDHPEYAKALFTKGELYFGRNKCNDARRFYKQALDIQKITLGEQHPDYIKTLKRLGQVELITGNNQNAAMYFVQTNRLSAEYIRSNYISLSEQEKITLLTENAEQFSYLLSMLAVQKYQAPLILQQAYNNELVLKNMVMLDQQNVFHTIKKSGNKMAVILYDKWKNDKSLYAVQLLKPIKERIPGMDSLKQKIIEEERELSRLSSQFNEQQQTLQLTANDIAQSLHKGEAAIELTRYLATGKNGHSDIKYAALLLTSGDTIPRFIPLCHESELIKLMESTEGSSAAVKFFYPGTGNLNYLEDSLSKKLYALAWKPIQPYLNDVSIIYYAPAGLFNRVAMQGLHINSKQLLIDRYEMIQLLSTRSVAISERPKQPANVNIWADIQYDYGDKGSNQQIKKQDDLWEANESPKFNFYNRDTRESRGGKLKPLPETKKEMEQIRQICVNGGLTVSVNNGIYATEDAFKALGNAPPQILHIATHGFFLPANDNAAKYANNPFVSQQNPMLRCGLALAGCNPAWTGKEPAAGEDGILTAYEIAQMDLGSTDIVVLSACETALGDINGSEGVIGLQRAFKMGGVKQIIMSLWKVPDKETSELMELFYRNWLSGMNASKALRTAQLSMKKKHDPYYWAAFVLIE